MGVSRMTGTPWHVEILSSGEPRRYKTKCKYYVKENNYCRLRSGQCWGVHYCTEYVLDEDKGKTTKVRNKSSQGSVKIIKPSVPKIVNKEEVDRVKVNRRKLLNACKENLLDDENLLFSNIAENNFIELWNKKGEKKVCDCGGKLTLLPEIEVYLRVEKELVFLLLPGKKCLECNKLFIVKNIAIENIREIKKEIEYQEKINSKFTKKGYQMKLSDFENKGH